jgi:hypothetical protein
VKLEGRVEKGRLVTDPAIWAIALREYEGQPVILEIEKKREVRTGRANRRHWTVIVPLARHHLNLKRGNELPPLSKDQTHYVLVTAFGASEETELGPVPIRSSLMTTKQFHEMDEKAGLWLRENGYPIPDGPEVSVEQAIEEATS